jgi:hypothetical protein
MLVNFVLRSEAQFQQWILHYNRHVISQQSVTCHKKRHAFQGDRRIVCVGEQGTARMQRLISK